MDNTPKSELKIGDMPVPRWFDAPPGVKDRSKKWVGIEAFTLDTQVKTFLFFQSLPYDIRTPTGRNMAANAVIQSRIEFDTDASIGPDIVGYDCETGVIEVSSDPTKVGLYIELGKRYGFRNQVKVGDIGKVPFEKRMQLLEQTLKVLPQPVNK